MHTLVNVNFYDPELLEFFERKTALIKTDNDYRNYAVTIFVDGIIYSYNGVHAVSDASNLVSEIIIIDESRFGVTILKTKEISNKNSYLAVKLTNYLNTLSAIIVKDMIQNDKVKATDLTKFSVHDFKEQMIKENSI